MMTADDQARDTTRCRDTGFHQFVVKPVRKTALHAAILDALGLAVAPTAAAETLPAAAETPLRILLAEDNVVNQKVASGLLERVGHTVVLAQNGKDALAALETGPFDLVLMDMQMPEMGGAEAMAIIRERERREGGHLPIIALTAHALKGDRERCIEAGADDYIPKPIVPATFFACINALGIKGTAAPLPAPVGDSGGLLAPVGGDPNLLAELIELFEAECPRQLAAIRQSLGAGDMPAVYRDAHTLKGSAGIFEAHELTALLQRLEARARGGDLATCRSVFASIEAEAARVIAMVGILRTEMLSRAS
jgi:two-component system, sensor histidine kinase and response regulator